MYKTCANCGCFNHSANDCCNSEKYWVGTQQPGRNGKKDNVAERDFLVIAAGKPCVISCGSKFWQNPQTKQYIFQRAPYPPSGYSETSRCSTCGSEPHSTLETEDCPKKDQFWVSTQSAQNAVKKVAKRDFIVMYQGQPLEIRCGQQFWQNAHTKQVVVGWHGSVSPPLDMASNSLLPFSAPLIFDKITLPGAPSPIVNKETFIRGDFGVLNPATFHQFRIVSFCGATSRIDNHRYEVSLTKGSSEYNAQLTGQIVFAMMKPHWNLYDLEIRRYFMEYRDSPNFPLE